MRIEDRLISYYTVLMSWGLKIILTITSNFDWELYPFSTTYSPSPPLPKYNHSSLLPTFYFSPTTPFLSQISYTISLCSIPPNPILLRGLWIEQRGSVITFSSFIIFLKSYAPSTPNHCQTIFEDDFAWYAFFLMNH